MTNIDVYLVEPDGSTWTFIPRQALWNGRMEAPSKPSVRTFPGPRPVGLCVDRKTHKYFAQRCSRGCPFCRKERRSEFDTAAYVDGPVFNV